MMGAPFLLFILAIISFVFWGVIFNLYNVLADKLDQTKFKKIGALKYSMIMTVVTLILFFIKMSTHSGPMIN